MSNLDMIHIEIGAAFCGFVCGMVVSGILFLRDQKRHCSRLVERENKVLALTLKVQSLEMRLESQTAISARAHKRPNWVTIEDTLALASRKTANIKRAAKITALENEIAALKQKHEIEIIANIMKKA